MDVGLIRSGTIRQAELAIRNSPRSHPARNKLACMLSTHRMSPAVTRVGWFFVATFALTWACQTPGILALRVGITLSGSLMALLALGSAGPSLIALAFVALESGRRGIGAMLLPRANLGWRFALLALLFPAAAHLIGSVVLIALGQYRAAHVVYPPLLPEQMAIAIIAPLGEEYAWRGYAHPRLQARVGPLAASLWVGLAWALWHIPTFFVPAARGTTSIELLLYLLAFLSSSVLYAWLFNVGRGSMLGPLLAHFGIHLDNVFRASASGDGIAPLFATTVVFVVAAVYLVATGRLRRSAVGMHTYSDA